jgi:phytoene dehydrogenase-like protein
MPDADVIIVGSGAGGMSAGLKMARDGCRVLLLEAMPSFGGYLNPFRRNGYRYDTGLHYVGDLAAGGSFRALLDELGLGRRLSFVELDPDGFDRYIFPHHEVRFCKGTDRFQQQLQQLFDNERPAIDRFFKVFNNILLAVRDAADTRGKWLLRLLFILRHPEMVRYHRQTYQQLIDKITSNRRLQAALSAMTGNLGTPPERASAILAVMVMNHYFSGAYYPEGGSGAMRDAFVDELQQHGATLKNDSRVQSIIKKGKEFVVVTAKGDTYAARAVISNVDPSLTLGELVSPPDMVPARLRKKAQRLQPSQGAFYAFVGTGLDLPALGISDANLIHINGYDLNAMINRLTACRIPDQVPYFFLTSPSVKDPHGGHAPGGYHSLQVITGTSYRLFEKWSHLSSGRRGPQYESLKRQIGMRLIREVERYIPGLSENITQLTFATPLTNEYWVGARKGGNFGPDQTPSQVGPGRFIDCSTGIRGLFLAGAGILGGGVMSCIASGFMAALKTMDFLQSRWAARPIAAPSE